MVYVDDDENIIGEEDEDEEITDGPAFSLTIGEEGTVCAMYTHTDVLMFQFLLCLPMCKLSSLISSPTCSHQDPVRGDLSRTHTSSLPILHHSIDNLLIV